MLGKFWKFHSRADARSRRDQTFNPERYLSADQELFVCSPVPPTGNGHRLLKAHGNATWQHNHVQQLNQAQINQEQVCAAQSKASSPTCAITARKRSRRSVTSATTCRPQSTGR